MVLFSGIQSTWRRGALTVNCAQARLICSDEHSSESDECVADEGNEAQQETVSDRAAEAHTSAPTEPLTVTSNDEVKARLDELDAAKASQRDVEALHAELRELREPITPAQQSMRSPDDVLAKLDALSSELRCAETRQQLALGDVAEEIGAVRHCRGRCTSSPSHLSTHAPDLSRPVCRCATSYWPAWRLGWRCSVPKCGGKRPVSRC
jgi:hypothetical protein